MDLKLAFCVPTFNRSPMIAEFLEQFASLYHQMGIDILYYDSSEDDNTETLVKRWMALYKNIYYYRVPSHWHANSKVLYIYEQFVQSSKYDYLWVCGDSMRHSECILRKIIAIFDIGYDMIIINGIDGGRIGTREYIMGNELFQDCAWHMTLFGAVILNVHTMLPYVPWAYIKKTYEIPERINYSHIGLYFETICRMDKFRAYYFAADGEVWGSKLKGKAGWYQDTFQTLCEFWPSAIEALPGYYTDKWSAINKLGYLSCLALWNIVKYRKGNIYNIQIFLKYRKVLTGMTHLNAFQLWSLARLNLRFAYCIATGQVKGYMEGIERIYRLHRFCKKKQKIYIYGAGRIAERYADYLLRKGIDYQGFLVTTRENNPGEFLNHPVIPLNEFIPDGGRAGIIIGLGKKNMTEIQPILEEHGLWKTSFHKYIMPIMLEDWDNGK